MNVPISVIRRSTPVNAPIASAARCGSSPQALHAAIAIVPLNRLCAPGTASFSVATALDSELLQKVATVTNGTYHAASDAAGLASVARGIDLRFKIVAQHIEVTALFAIGAALLLVAGGLLSIMWFGRVV